MEINQVFPICITLFPVLFYERTFVNYRSVTSQAPLSSAPAHPLYGANSNAGSYAGRSPIRIVLGKESYLLALGDICHRCS